MLETIYNKSTLLTVHNVCMLLNDKCMRHKRHKTQSVGVLVHVVWFPCALCRLHSLSALRSTAALACHGNISIFMLHKRVTPPHQHPEHIILTNGGGGSQNRTTTGMTKPIVNGVVQTQRGALSRRAPKKHVTHMRHNDTTAAAI